MQDFYHKMKDLNRYLDILLKIIPIAIAVFFIGSILFNTSYFWHLDSQWSSLLTLSDYYEGSAEAIIFLGSVGMLFWGLRKMFKTIYECLRMLKPLLSVLPKLLSSYLKFWYIKMQFLSIHLWSKKLKKATFSIKKKYVLCKKGIPSINKDLSRTSQQIFILCTKVCLFGIMGVLGIFFIVPLGYSIYIYNWKLFSILILFYFGFKLLEKDKSDKLLNFIFILVFYWICMWCIGMISATEKRGTNFFPILRIMPFQRSKVLSVDNSEYLLLRTINKGVIATQKDNTLIFLKWEEVKALIREGNDKKQLEKV